MPKKKLTEKQRRFVRAFVGKAEGNATKAARIAGYKHPNKKGPELVKVGVVAEAIEAHVEQEEKQSVMDRQERQDVLSEIGRGNWEPKDRIRAIDTLNKMDGLYIQKHEHLFKASPQETEEAVIEMYRSNPELWQRIKKAVER